MQLKSRNKSTHPLLYGTLILTLTGFLSRIIGFFYRIYLSRLFGEEGMGVYQLLSPVLSISFSLSAAGFQTAISKLVAENTKEAEAGRITPLWTGLLISTPIALLLTGIIYVFADPIGRYYLQEARCIPLLRVLAFSIPFSSVHACINGYFYGRKKAGIPASSQLVEQMVRVGCVYLCTNHPVLSQHLPSILSAVLGLTVGEIFSMAYASIPLLLSRKASSCNIPATYQRRNAKLIMAMVLPLTANRIALNILQSIEAVSLPAGLRNYGYDNATALRVYGVFTGMALPFIFFPNALTSSISILLLPEISENQAMGNMKKVADTTKKTIRYCGALGFLSMLFFLMSGRWLGNTVFQSPLAGYFITTLSFICPFLYLDTTLSGILQGLGLVNQLFLINLGGLALRLGFVFLAVPTVGMTGYLWGVLGCQLFVCLFYLLTLKKHLHLF